MRDEGQCRDEEVSVARVDIRMEGEVEDARGAGSKVKGDIRDKFSSGVPESKTGEVIDSEEG